MKGFWTKPAVKDFLVEDIFDIDEIVRRFGGSHPADNDYEIVRSYYYWEWQGEEDWITIPTTKEDYEKYKDNEEFQYRTELNYNDFEDKFWFEGFEQTLNDYRQQFEEINFISCVENTFFTLNFEGQAKMFLRNVLTGLDEMSNNLKEMIRLNDKYDYNKINKIQEIVINHYSSLYKYTKNQIIQHYKFIYPEIENNFSQNLDLSEIKSLPRLIEKKQNEIWFEIGKLIAIGDIEFKTIKNIGTEIYYKQEKYDSGNSLGEKLSAILDRKASSLKSFINDTINGTMDKNRKNIFNSLNKAKKLMLFCKENQHTPSDYLLKKIQELKVIEEYDN